MKQTRREFYAAPVNVWVEDTRTKNVLETLWKDTQINVIAGTGKSAVRAVVESETENADRVFGVVDRDFDEDERGSWDQPEVRVHKLPAHEIENVLLDFEVIAGMTAGQHTADSLKRLAHGHAVFLKWWAGCKAVLRGMAGELGVAPEDPPKPPAGSVKDLASAQTFLEGQQWNNLPAVITRLRNDLQVRLRTEASRVQEQLDGDEWLETFPGKELFVEVWRCVEPSRGLPARAMSNPPKQRQDDFGKDIARELARPARRSTRISGVLELRDVLRRKAGIAAPR